MAKKISASKGLDYTPSFDTYVPELADNADIQNAFVCNPEYRRADLKATSDAFTVYAKTIPTQTPTQDE